MYSIRIKQNRKNIENMEREQRATKFIRMAQFMNLNYIH